MFVYNCGYERQREKHFFMCPLLSRIVLKMISGRNTYRTAASGLSGSVVLIL